MPAPQSHTFLLTHYPQQEEISALCEIIPSLIKTGDEAYLYAIYQGIGAIYSIEIQSLRQHGLKLMGCAYAAEKHHLPLDDSAVFCGLGMLADLILHSTKLTLFPQEPTLLPRKNVLIRPRKASPCSNDVFEIYRVASGLSSITNLRVHIPPLPLENFPELSANSDFQHFQEICKEHALLIGDSGISQERNLAVLEF